MREFSKSYTENRTVCYNLFFENDEYIVVFNSSGLGQVYSHTEYRKLGEERFAKLNERVWTLAISQALEIIKGLENLEIDPNGGLLK